MIPFAQLVKRACDNSCGCACNCTKFTKIILQALPSSSSLAKYPNDGPLNVQNAPIPAPPFGEGGFGAGGGLIPNPDPYLPCPCWKTSSSSATHYGGPYFVFDTQGEVHSGTTCGSYLSGKIGIVAGTNGCSITGSNGFCCCGNGGGTVFPATSSSSAGLWPVRDWFPCYACCVNADNTGGGLPSGQVIAYPIDSLIYGEQGTFGIPIYPQGGFTGYNPLCIPGGGGGANFSCGVDENGLPIPGGYGNSQASLGVGCIETITSNTNIYGTCGVTSGIGILNSKFTKFLPEGGTINVNFYPPFSDPAVLIPIGLNCIPGSQTQASWIASLWNGSDSGTVVIKIPQILDYDGTVLTSATTLTLNPHGLLVIYSKQAGSGAANFLNLQINKTYGHDITTLDSIGDKQYYVNGMAAIAFQEYSVTDLDRTQVENGDAIDEACTKMSCFSGYGSAEWRVIPMPIGDEDIFGSSSSSSSSTTSGTAAFSFKMRKILDNYSGSVSLSYPTFAYLTVGSFEHYVGSTPRCCTQICIPTAQIYFARNIWESCCTGTQYVCVGQASTLEIPLGAIAKFIIRLSNGLQKIICAQLIDTQLVKSEDLTVAEKANAACPFEFLGLLPVGTNCNDCIAHNFDETECVPSSSSTSDTGGGGPGNGGPIIVSSSSAPPPASSAPSTPPNSSSSAPSVSTSAPSSSPPSSSPPSTSKPTSTSTSTSTSSPTGSSGPHPVPDSKSSSSSKSKSSGPSSGKSSSSSGGPCDCHFYKIILQLPSFSNADCDDPNVVKCTVWSGKFVNLRRYGSFGPVCGYAWCGLFCTGDGGISYGLDNTATLNLDFSSAPSVAVVCVVNGQEWDKDITIHGALCCPFSANLHTADIVTLGNQCMPIGTECSFTVYCSGGGDWSGICAIP